MSLLHQSLLVYQSGNKEMYKPLKLVNPHILKQFNLQVTIVNIFSRFVTVNVGDRGSYMVQPIRMYAAIEL